MDYYDLVLGTIPASFLGVSGILATVGMDFAIAVPVGALLAVGIILHALFVRSPAMNRNPTPEPSPAQSTNQPRNLTE